MNKFKTLAVVLFSSAALLATSCTKENDATPEPVKATTLSVNTVTDLDGSKGEVYYSLSTNKQVLGDDITAGKWDLKFSTTSIFVNGGTSGTGTTQAQVVSSIFDDVKTAPADGFKTDATGANAITGWHLYTATNSVPNHAILAVPGKIIVIKTSDGKYAKLEMKSYYKGNPDTTTPAFADLTTRPASSYYTFRFAYQANGSTTLQ
ncbi:MULTISPECIES: HmuY family protein [unclassified Mucilaginibacter]|uniref:HmuY family protein n=1 Tax=unclassified Mucilaginibacter TaxID=2617802 RepID=UPI002AC9D4FD|nr:MULTISPECIES: HmuY family protein [unclassified Mucilaginibacter]MEB0248901.1 HmuY family protein [Mucilaginibacter sp. 5B2]MEB0261417.1 HmuY family protein [Mucilaginibacter sp. 10I4]MEB0278824.1 HmuY family protein [Mucilaginibacter sp. 10B2]MEB0299811.1 HmuY family protein [Mucilaginibacter sp. 5C4]WPX22006.1 HmuY family protein [Mucilaginibacter sp. 5C4]